jgi:tRNA(adenine34) deaminase
VATTDLKTMGFRVVEWLVSSFLEYFQPRFAGPNGGWRARLRMAQRPRSNHPVANVFAKGATPPSSIDRVMMARCIELSKETPKGELPFAALVTQGGRIVAHSHNRVVRDCDVSRHAELVALAEAQSVTGSLRLRGCVLYTNVEPCPMCSFAIRETGIDRVVYAIRSRAMGGHSRWSILDDDQLSRVMPGYFSPPPELVADFCAEEAEKVWNDRHPLIWRMIKARGCLG